MSVTPYTPMMQPPRQDEFLGRSARARRQPRYPVGVDTDSARNRPTQPPEAPEAPELGIAPELPPDVALGGRAAPTPQPGPHHYAPAPDDIYPDGWPWFWPDGSRADRGVYPTVQPDWFIGRDVLPGEVLVSTVFLSLDHDFMGMGVPVLWETMVFGLPKLEVKGRYVTRQGALEGHARVLHEVREALKAQDSEGGEDE